MVSLPQSLILICKVGIKILHKVIRFKIITLMKCLHGAWDIAFNKCDGDGQNHW